MSYNIFLGYPSSKQFDFIYKKYKKTQGGYWKCLENGIIFDRYVDHGYKRVWFQNGSDQYHIFYMLSNGQWVVRSEFLYGWTDTGCSGTEKYLKIIKNGQIYNFKWFKE